MKLIAILISALLALGASAEPALETISGTVTEYVESEYMMLDTAEHGEIQVNLSAETPMETDGAIQAGDYVYVAFDGTMTMSLPAQISAKSVTMHKLKGDIVEVKDGDALIRTSDGTEVLVHLPDDWANAELDAPQLIAYYNGAITMSLPGQISAGKIVPCYTLNGVVDEIGDGFLTIDSDGEKIQVNADSIPENLKVDDVICVTYDGIMTRSIPAQITAIEITLVSR